MNCSERFIGGKAYDSDMLDTQMNEYGVEISSVRLEVEQHQLVGRTYSYGSVEIGLQGA